MRKNQNEEWEKEEREEKQTASTVKLKKNEEG